MEKKTDISKAGKTDIGKLKSLSVQYRIDKKGNVCFYNPSCDEIPLTLFFKMDDLKLIRYEYERNYKYTRNNLYCHS